MFKFSCFADEISPDLQEQIAEVKRHGIEYISFRSVWDKFVGQLSDEELQKVRSELKSNKIKVSSIGSHIGKITMDDDFEAHYKLFERILDIAQLLETQYVRIFSFFMDRDEYSKYENEVIERLARLVRLAEKKDIILLHENETEVFGETSDNCVKIYKSIPSNNLKHCFDPCNFVMAGEDILNVSFPKVKDKIVYFHVKDYSLSKKTTIVAGEGDGRIPEILDALKQRDFMFLTVEPHLVSGNNRRGFTGPDLFAEAYQAIRKILEDISAKYE
ncbi:MAG: sugar phosphate isomerase/epimerase family protein [Saccharofermentanales bacterium]|jgi:L-ribulose-5-phosphate 3-epimerase